MAAWAKVVASGRLHDCPPGLVVGALRANFLAGDRKTVDALASHVSRSIRTLLRRIVGMNHPNQGEDIIERAAGVLLEAIFDPLSRDGDNLVVAFASRVRYRGIDAARAEGLHHARIVDLGTDDDGEACLPDGRPLGGGGGSMAVSHVLGRITDPRQRLAFQLHMEGMRTYRGDPCIASVCGCHPKTAARWIASARRRLVAEI